MRGEGSESHYKKILPENSVLAIKLKQLQAERFLFFCIKNLFIWKFSFKC